MRLDRSRAELLLENLQGCPVAVIGDLMLDEYLFGEVNRISPEAPVPIVRVTKERWVLGGAANVAANLKAIGATPILLGTLRDDGAGRRLQGLLSEQDIATTGLVTDETRPTIIKTRVIGQQQQMLRIDREESRYLDDATVKALTQKLANAIQTAKAVIVSDYAKGVIDERLLDALRDQCLVANIPWIVDPKPSHKSFYHGATLMTPNTKELTELTGLPSQEDQEVAKAARKLAEDLGLGGLLVTRSHKGMALFAPEALHQEPWLIPTEAREVYDVSGAGDTVIGIFSASVAAGADWKEAAMLANAAAGVVVGKMGTATVTVPEVLAHYQDQKAY